MATVKSFKADVSSISTLSVALTNSITFQEHLCCWDLHVDNLITKASTRLYIYWGFATFTAILRINSTSYLTPSSYPSLCIAWKSGDLQNHHHNKTIHLKICLLPEQTRIPRKMGYEFQLPQIRNGVLKNLSMNRCLFKLVWSYFVMFYYSLLSLFISCYRY